MPTIFPFESIDMCATYGAITCMPRSADLKKSNHGAGIAYSDSCNRMTEIEKHVSSS
jgi:hypothetical protein